MGDVYGPNKGGKKAKPPSPASVTSCWRRWLGICWAGHQNAEQRLGAPLAALAASHGSKTPGKHAGGVVVVAPGRTRRQHQHESGAAPPDGDVRWQREAPLCSKNLTRAVRCRTGGTLDTHSLLKY